MLNKILKTKWLVTMCAVHIVLLFLYLFANVLIKQNKPLLLICGYSLIAYGLICIVTVIAYLSVLYIRNKKEKSNNDSKTKE